MAIRQRPMGVIRHLAGEGQVIGEPLTLVAELTDAEITIDPDTASADLLTWGITNSGALDHEFLILQTDDVAADVIALGIEDDVADLDAYTVAGSSGVIAAGDSTVFFADLAEGHYVIVSNQVNDVFAGMVTEFTVSAIDDDPARLVNAIGRVVRRAGLPRGVREVKTPASSWRINK